EVSATLENKINTSKSENVTASETPKSIKKRDIPDAYDSNSMLTSANESLTQPPADGYSVNSELPTNNKVTYNAHKAAEPKQYTVEVDRRGEGGDRQYVLSGRKEHVDRGGSNTIFFVTVFRKDKNTLVKEIDIKTITPRDIQLHEIAFLDIVAKK